jgi:hypothetical protein
MRESDAAGNLPEHFAPALTPAERTPAGIEGCLLGLH